MISDVDEIPSREIVAKLKADESLPSLLLLKQDFYYYNIRCHRGKRWYGTMAMRFGSALAEHGHSAANARYAHNVMRYVNKECGWHFAHFYDAAGIREKLRHSSHRGYNNSAYHNDEWLKECVEQNKNYLGKQDGNELPEAIPQYMLDEIKRFPIFMGEL